MIPRPRQRQFVERAHAALERHKNTLGIAVTGFGKTAVLGFLAARYKGKQLILQHRDELVAQNSATYAAINPKRKQSFIDGRRKRQGNTTFGMFQTLAANHDLIPSDLSLIVADEAHHTVAPTYREVIDIALERSPNAHLLGLTATPRVGMAGLFDNVCDHVTIKEMMAVGLLTPIRSYACVTDKTRQKLDAIGRVSNTGEQTEVSNVLDNPQILDDVYREWQERAGDRKTVVFCSSVDHASHVADYFSNRGVCAKAIHGAMGRSERREIIEGLDSGDIQVVTNVFVLTEGWDCPPVSCAILLRQCSDLGPLVQMVGRILRIHPGKRDAILLDFGTSILTHGTLEQNAELLPEVESEGGVGVTKFCPEIYGDTHDYRFPDANGKVGCGAELPANTRTCPLCGFVFDRIGHTHGHVAVELTEIDLLNASPFRYVDLFGDGCSLMASGFEAWALVVTTGNDVWHAIGGRGNEFKRLHYGNKLQALAASDDYMRVYETDANAKKASYWMTECATRKQCELLQRFGYRLTIGLMGCNELTKYEAACHYKFATNKNKIVKCVNANALSIRSEK